MRAYRFTLVAAAAFLFFNAAPAMADESDPLVRIRLLYLAAVEEEAAIASGLLAIDALRASGVQRPELDAVLAAYRGSLVTLRAKHAVWPPTRLRHLREGLEVLDRLVEEHPDIAEIRYLRLMSCYYLPAILGRGSSVREDFAALAELLPSARDAYPPELFRTIVEFVIDNGATAPAHRAALVEALRATEDG